jgi:GNAT superfamily N-acetyltransferase
VIDVLPLDSRSPDRVLDELPVNRLGQEGGQYLIAWDDDVPVGHLNIASREPPEIQDVFVRDECRGRGIARTLINAAAELCSSRGATRLRLEVNAQEADLQSMYERMGFRDAGLPLRHVVGEIELRVGSIQVDNHLRTLELSLPHGAPAI